MSIQSICHALDSRFCAFIDARKAAEAAEAAKAAVDMKIFDEIFEFVDQGLTEDQAYHAVAHARNISVRDVRDARRRVQRAMKRDMEDRAMADSLDGFIEFLFSFPVAVIMFFGCLIFMAFACHIK